MKRDIWDTWENETLSSVSYLLVTLSFIRKVHELKTSGRIRRNEHRITKISGGSAKLIAF